MCGPWTNGSSCPACNGNKTPPEFAWETGCRPQEVKATEARQVHLAEKMILFPPGEAKGKRRWRRILLEGRAYEIVARLLGKRPCGSLFVNARGRPWTAYCMANRFRRLKKHLGVKYFAYAFRHGFCQRLLEGGTRSEEHTSELQSLRQ